MKEVLEGLFYPKQNDRLQKRMPDYGYVHKELLRNGVSKKLLWTEYMEDCRANGDEPLMYSRFCYYIQQDEQKRRATMQINRKPGEQAEVDWAGDHCTREYLERAKTAFLEAGGEHIPNQAEQRVIDFENNIEFISKIRFDIAGFLPEAGYDYYEY